MKILTKVNCNGCGSEMTFSPKLQKLKCEHCGNTKEIEETTPNLIEVDIQKGLDWDNLQSEELDQQEFIQCNGCGATFSITKKEISNECPFCGAKSVIPAKFEERKIKPQGIIPFKITREQAAQKVKEWLGKGFFTPNNVKKLASIEHIRGVYIPMWTFDIKMEANYSVDIGYYYTDTEEYEDTDGNIKTRTVTKTRWEPYHGTRYEFFDDIPVAALNENVLQNYFKNISNFSLKSIKGFNPQYLLGFETSLYNKPLKQGLEEAEKIAKEKITQIIEDNLPGDDHRFLTVNTKTLNATFKHLIVPVWIINYKYKGKNNQIVINGENGQISGEKPISIAKVILVFAIIVILYLLFEIFT